MDMESIIMDNPMRPKEVNLDLMEARNGRMEMS